MLLLDEPFAGGMDPSALLALKRILLYYRDQRQRTVVIATPVPELVEELADRVGIIADGRLTAFSTVAEFRDAAGGVGLAEAYERQVNPDAIEKVGRYLRGEDQ